MPLKTCPACGQTNRPFSKNQALKPDGICTACIELKVASSRQVVGAAAASSSSQQQDEVNLDEHVKLLEKHSSVAELLRARSIAFIADFMIQNAEDALHLAHVCNSFRDTMIHYVKDAVFSRVADTSPHALFISSPTWLRDKLQRTVTDPAIKNIVARCKLDANLDGHNLLDKRVLLGCMKELGLQSDSWNSENPVEKFAGVFCNMNDRVTIVDLNYCNMSGKIPSSISQLTRLEHLNLEESNQLQGELPSSLGDLVNLKTLRLGGNNFCGSLFDFSRLTKLEHVSLCSNSFSGPIPSSISQLKQLKSLDLSDNDFSPGRCPDTIRSLPLLKNLVLDERNM